MQVDTFFKHYSVTANPFAAEEARLDPIFSQLLAGGATHPDYPKIAGQVDQPSTAVVFGEKGSGKTAMRLLMGQQIAEHNQQNPDRKVLIVAYDDLNPVLDRLLRVRKQNTDAMLKQLRLEDHQDAILARAVTRLTQAILGDTETGDAEALVLDDATRKKLRKLPKSNRTDLAVLAALYDQPRSGDTPQRFDRLRKALRVGTGLAPTMGKLCIASTVATAAALVLGVWKFALGSDSSGPWWLIPAFAAAAGLTLIGWGFWLFNWFKLWAKSRKAIKDTPAIQRETNELRAMLAALPIGAADGQPLPVPARPGQTLSDARYQLTRKLVDLLLELGYTGVIIFVDRVDEPTVVHGDAEKMKAITWPMFDNKFLKQDRIGIKLLLPLELGYMLKREGPAFFQEARLDKQNLVEKLTWSGATLYDLCTLRLRAVSTPGTTGEDGQPIKLTDLFEDDVDPSMLIDALDQMHQPRDAFKFLYAVVQEHCKLVPEDDGRFQIARLTLETVRKQQSQRVQELHRGLGPA
ncbi:MAG: hypothetical protein AAF750_14760 [Planctomycetota bacterium]